MEPLYRSVNSVREQIPETEAEKIRDDWAINAEEEANRIELSGEEQKALDIRTEVLKMKQEGLL